MFLVERGKERKEKSFKLKRVKKRLKERGRCRDGTKNRTNV